MRICRLIKWIKGNNDKKRELKYKALILDLV